MLSLILIAALGQQPACTTGTCPASFSRPAAGAIRYERYEAVYSAPPVLGTCPTAASPRAGFHPVRGVGRVAFAPVRGLGRVLLGGCR